MEAPQGVELTGTNGGKAIILHHPGPGWWPVLRPSDDSRWQGASGMRHKTVFRVHCPVPGPSRSDPPGSVRGRSTRFAAAMARVRRPVPFRTRKLRPCTAMVLHPRGCGRVARRRFHTIRFPPVEPPRAPGGFLFSPAHARAGGQGDAAPHPPRTPGRNPYKPTGTGSKQLTCDLHIAGVEPKSTGRTCQSSMIPSTFKTV